MGVKDTVLGRMLESSDTFTEQQVAQTLQLLLEHGVKHGASSIHIEPHERVSLVRYRVHGALRSVHKLPAAAHTMIVRELKRRAGLDTSNSKTPQDGEINATVGKHALQAHVSVMPIVGGEKIVLHLATNDNQLPELGALGFWGESLASLRRALTQPHGIIVVTGLRRSGISTTLHVMLEALRSPLTSIGTFEPRILRHIAGATQVAASQDPERAANQLRALLGHDVNILMTDRSPDKPTAQLAVEASAQGHLLLHGVHAPDSLTGVIRLRSLSSEPFLLASELRAATSQRLVRRLCPNCRQQFAPDLSTQQELAARFELTTPARRERLHQLEQAAKQHDLNADLPLATTKGHIAHLWKAKNGGCAACDHTGYQGVACITEVCSPGDDLRSAIAHSADSTELHNKALKDGFVPLALDGLVKALRGLTTVNEVLRTVAA